MAEMNARRLRPVRLVAGAAALLLAAASLAAPLLAADQSVGELPLEAFERLEAARRLDDLSGDLWPHWDVSDASFALYRPHENCYLIHHSDPPDDFERLRGRLPVRGRVYWAPASPDHVTPETGFLGGEPTAYLDLDEFGEQPLPVVFREAFRAYHSAHCQEMTEPVDLFEGYPLTAKNLMLADIECELLARAVRAPDDSLEERTLEFLAVRAVRRIGILGESVRYERWREVVDGIPAYVGERCREMAAPFLDGERLDLLAAGLDGPGCFEACAESEGTLAWYSCDRFACTGASICLLLDRLAPDWKREVEERCIEPYEMLWVMRRTEIPMASEVLERYDVDARTAEKEAFILSLKSEPERLFEEIAAGDHRILAVDTHLLASSQVSYDPENIVEVDDHRVVHKRVIKIEYSGGTHVHVIGRPVAAVVGEGEFDIEQLIMEAPEEYSVTIGGQPLTLERGVHQITGHLSVEGAGLSIEAEAGLVMVGEDKVTFMLHR
jgi:hypothetical protein